jgi:hypothetical protein
VSNGVVQCNQDASQPESSRVVKLRGFNPPFISVSHPNLTFLYCKLNNHCQLCYSSLPVLLQPLRSHAKDFFQRNIVPRQIGYNGSLHKNDRMGRFDQGIETGRTLVIECSYSSSPPYAIHNVVIDWNINIFFQLVSLLTC